MTLSETVKNYLRACGFSEAEISSWNSSTDLLRDIRAVGDDFLEMMEVLHQRFGVDLSQFDWTRHTPEEVSADSAIEAERWFWNWIRPGYVERRLAKYEPVTLGMIEEALIKGRWEY